MNAGLKHFIKNLELVDSGIGVLGVVIILGAAIFVQFFYGEQPCPLCLLQRAAFISVGLALLMNLRYKNRVAHWALAIISSVAGIAVSIRQILLHITSDIGFGRSVFGLHMYTWCFIAFGLTILGSAFMLLIYPEKKPTEFDTAYNE
jgi:disulfide bond formation protein DsbB